MHAALESPENFNNAQEFMAEAANVMVEVNPKVFPDFDTAVLALWDWVVTLIDFMERNDRFSAETGTGGFILFCGIDEEDETLELSLKRNVVDFTLGGKDNSSSTFVW